MGNHSKAVEWDMIELHQQMSRGKTKLRLVLNRLLIVFGLILSTATIVGAEPHKISMGGHPACEASAGIEIPCPETGKTCLLVGDNEIKDKMFLYELHDSVPVLRNMRTIKMGPFAPGTSTTSKVKDIEAIARLPGGELVVFGSHGRNKACKKRPSRRRKVEGLISGGQLTSSTQPLIQTNSLSCSTMFTVAGDTMSVRFCERMTETETLAKLAAAIGDETACAVDPAFNLEGAVAIADTDGIGRVWVGLRAPIVDGKAVLLRQIADRSSFQFDAIAMMDLGGRGIRELTLSEGSIWGIGGPAADGPQKHTLWHFPVSALQPGATITPNQITTLPTSSEGLVIRGHRAIVMIDGDEPTDEVPGQCAVDSKYVVIDLGPADN